MPITRSLDIVFCKDTVAGKYRERLGGSLSDEETVEQITIVLGKCLQLENVLIADREEPHAIGFHFIAKVRDRGADGVKLASLDLDGDLPEGYETEEEFMLVRTEDLSSPRRPPKYLDPKVRSEALPQ